MTDSNENVHSLNNMKPIDADDVPKLVSSKKLKAELEETKCERCESFVENVDTHSCAPIRRKFDRLVKELNINSYTLNDLFDKWTKFRKEYPLSESTFRCERCSILVHSTLLHGHLCNPKKGKLFTEFDLISLKYGNEKLIHEEVDAWYENSL